MAERTDHPIATDLHARPVTILRSLIRFETVNPPGNEKPCIAWIADVLDAYGIAYETYSKDPDRPNLLARVPGGDAPPLLLYGHVDVVPVTDQEWTHPPFEAVLEDGMVWGRGALDMKDGVAMFLAAFLRTAVAASPPAGDLLFLAVSDEEAGGDDGLSFLVDEHPALFDEVEYALGEFGGFSFEVAGVETYPIQINEKQVCWIRATFAGESGHAALPLGGSALGKLAAFVAALEDARLPVHVTPDAEAMIEAVVDAIPADRRESIRALVEPERTDGALDTMEDALLFDAILHNTATPTVVRGGEKENVIPERVALTIDCRLLPGQTPADVLGELEAFTPEDGVEFEVIRFDAVPPTADMGLYDLLGDVLESAVDDAVAIPLLLPFGTDGRHLSRVDVQSYGYTPLRLGDLPFLDLFHSGDERVPVEAIEWGTDRVREVVSRYEG